MVLNVSLHVLVLTKVHFPAIFICLFWTEKHYGEWFYLVILKLFWDATQVQGSYTEGVGAPSSLAKKKRGNDWTHKQVVYIVLVKGHSSFSKPSEQFRC